MTGAGSAAGSTPLTRRSGRGLRGHATPLVVAGVAVLMVVLAVARLDPVYDKVPGVFRSWQLMPLPLEVRYELAGVRRDFGDKTPAEEHQKEEATGREARNVALLRAKLNHLSDDVSVRSWQEGSGAVVAVGVADVDDAEQAVPGLGPFPEKTAARTFAVGGRYVVAVTVTQPRKPVQRAKLADTTVDQVEASVGMARVLWWEVISLGPFLLLPVLFGLAYLVWIVAWLAFNILKLVLYLAVVLPLSLLGLRKREPPPRPLLSDDPLGQLAPGVERVRAGIATARASTSAVNQAAALGPNGCPNESRSTRSTPGASCPSGSSERRGRGGGSRLRKPRSESGRTTAR